MRTARRQSARLAQSARATSFPEAFGLRARNAATCSTRVSRSARGRPRRRVVLTDASLPSSAAGARFDGPRAGRRSRAPEPRSDALRGSARNRADVGAAPDRRPLASRALAADDCRRGPDLSGAVRARQGPLPAPPRTVTLRPRTRLRPRRSGPPSGSPAAPSGARRSSARTRRRHARPQPSAPRPRRAVPLRP
jgi:hypothetical protein